jgi:cytidine deaminase
MQHATLLCRGGSIVACACNREGVHSEIAAINKVKRDKRKGLTFINIRVRRDGSLGVSTPCPACKKRLKAEGITRGYCVIPWFFTGEDKCIDMVNVEEVCL